MRNIDSFTNTNKTWNWTPFSGLRNKIAKHINTQVYWACDDCWSAYAECECLDRVQ